MSTDHLRFAAITAARQVMRELETNAVAQPHVWRAVTAALDGYEDQMALDLHDRLQPGWALVVDGRPIVVVPTRRVARGQRKILAHLAGRPVRDYKIVATEVALTGPLIRQ